MKNNNIILYAAILIFGVVAPFVLPAGNTNGATTPKINIAAYKMMLLFFISNTLFF